MVSGFRWVLLICGLHALLSGCTYIVDSKVDAPDANPGDFVCARALPEGGGLTTGDDGGLCTLRAAVMEANATAIAERIEVPPGTYKLTLPLNKGGGALVIKGDVLIRGAGAGSTILDAGYPGCPALPRLYQWAVFSIESGNVGISDLTVQNADDNGIVVHAGEAEISDAIVRRNFASHGSGGGIQIKKDGILTIRRTTVIENCDLGGYGGAAFNAGELWIYDSLIQDNFSSFAGGISSSGLLNLRNTTMSGNFAQHGGVGALRLGGFTFLNNVTITDNRGAADFVLEWEKGGGISIAEGATVVVKNSIIAGNDGSGYPNDCDGALSADSRYNLIGDSDGCVFTGSTATFLLDVDPGLAPLANNGGPTLTHALLAASPAREAGYPFAPGSGAADACEAYDQRGVPRPQGGGLCDIGAVEMGNIRTFVTGFAVVDLNTGRDVQSVRNGELLNLSKLPKNAAIRAVLIGSAGSVMFNLNDGVSGRTGGGDQASSYTDNSAPFVFSAPIAPGTHSVRATPYAQPNGAGPGGGSLLVTFHVVASE